MQGLLPDYLKHNSYNRLPSFCHHNRPSTFAKLSKPGVIAREFAVHKQVVVNMYGYVFFRINTATLIAVATPSGIDDGIVVRLNLSLSANVTLVRA